MELNLNGNIPSLERRERLFVVRKDKVAFSVLAHSILPSLLFNKSADVDQPTTDRRRAWEEFCESTTIHGLSFIVNYAEPRRVRIIFSLAVIIFFFFMITLCWLSSAALFTGTISTSMTTESPTHQLFPRIHICDKSYFSKQRLLEMGFNSTLGTYLITAQSSLLMSRSFRQEIDSNRLLSEELSRLLKPYDGNISAVTHHAALSCEEMIAGCIEDSRRHNGSICCSRFFSKTKQINEFGSCTMTRQSKLDKEYLASSQRGFIILFRQNVHDSIEFDDRIMSPSFSEKAGIIFTISTNTILTYSALLSELYLMEAGKAAMVSMRVTETVNEAMKGDLLAPYDCAYKTQLEYFVFGEKLDYYSKANCKLTVMQETYRTLFNCSLMSIPNTNTNLPYCSPKNFVGQQYEEAKKQYVMKNNALKRSCTIDCRETTYSATITHGDLYLSNYSRKQYGISNEHWVYSMTSLHFYFPTLTYTKIVNKPDSLLKWMGAIGGNMGLTLGASLISVLEILLLCYHCVFPTKKPSTIRPRRIRKRYELIPSKVDSNRF